jgi:hypothetical protein
MCVKFKICNLLEQIIIRTHCLGNKHLSFWWKAINIFLLATRRWFQESNRYHRASTTFITRGTHSLSLFHHHHLIFFNFPISWILPLSPVNTHPHRFWQPSASSKPLSSASLPYPNSPTGPVAASCFACSHGDVALPTAHGLGVVAMED